MSRFYFFLLAVVTTLLGVSAFWNYRLYHENHRVAKLLAESRKGKEAAPAPAKVSDRATVQAKIKEERETLDVLSQRLREAQAALDAADNLPKLKAELEQRKTTVAAITRKWEKAGGRRVSATELESMKRQLDKQIDAEERSIADLKVRRSKLLRSRSPATATATKSLLQATETQAESHGQVLAELRNQRAALARQKPRPSETPQKRRERERLQETLAVETEAYEKTKALYEQANALSDKDREETRQLADVVQFHESALRDLERELTARGTK